MPLLSLKNIEIESVSLIPQSLILSWFVIGATIVFRKDRVVISFPHRLFKKYYFRISHMYTGKCDLTHLSFPILMSSGCCQFQVFFFKKK